jgi:ABC-type bacteriocin/lantibiotic exporter with double-glycine peptidase domain
VAENRNEIVDPQSGDILDAAQQKTVGHPFSDNPRMTCREVNVYYGDKQAIRNVSLDIGKNEVIAMIGPSGCGKSTLSALPEPHERHHRHLPGDRRDQAG